MIVDKRENYKPQPGEIPNLPGVYRFLSEKNRILYIGKAKNLRSRLNNYFQPLNSLPARTQRMLQLAAAVDWTVVASDTEALTLEHSWIQHFQPPFNVQFRDDKSYASLAVTLQDDAPRLLITRNRKIRGAKYFGPFPKLWAVKELTVALQQAFPIRTCNPADYKRAIRSGKACLSGQIGRCFGPCSKQVTYEEHRARVMQLIRFLNGQDAKLLSELKAQMNEAAKSFEYEKAAKIRDQIEGIQHVLEQNVMVLGADQPIDVFGIAADDFRAAIHQFVIRNGRIRAEHSWLVDFELDAGLPRVLEQALQTAYAKESAPPLILVPQLPESLSELEVALYSGKREGGTVKISVPKRGERRALVERASVNAKEQLTRALLKRAGDLIARTDALSELQKYLELETPPMKIECIDVSHLGGTETVASLVSFEDGLPKKKMYRTYKVAKGNDDPAAIYEVVSRRAEYYLKEIADDPHIIPDLLLIDGGLPQVNSAARALKERGLDRISTVGIAKRLEELWKPAAEFPVILPRSSEALFLIQRIRDEAHRFAITFQRKRRTKTITTSLTEIPGIGEATAKNLLRHFGSVKKIKEASIEELSEVKGISEVTANKVLTHLQNN